MCLNEIAFPFCLRSAEVSWLGRRAGAPPNPLHTSLLFSVSHIKLFFSEQDTSEGKLQPGGGCSGGASRALVEPSHSFGPVELRHLHADHRSFGGLLSRDVSEGPASVVRPLKPSLPNRRLWNVTMRTTDALF